MVEKIDVKLDLCHRCNYKAELKSGGILLLTGWWWVECKRCGLRSRRENSPEEAAKAWNK
jgi:hypothetical protein